MTEPEFNLADELRRGGIGLLAQAVASLWSMRFREQPYATGQNELEYATAWLRARKQTAAAVQPGNVEQVAYCICSRPYGGEHEHGCPARPQRDRLPPAQARTRSWAGQRENSDVASGTVIRDIAHAFVVTREAILELHKWDNAAGTSGGREIHARELEALAVIEKALGLLATEQTAPSESATNGSR